tara:strand:- start:3 stop:377 length:375 start_codon:yes stop_codon:yes gene_type:complete
MCRVTEYKECKDCKEVKPKGGFTPNKKCLDGTEGSCKNCRSKRKREANRIKKKQLVSLAGGKCEVCGYSKCDSALEFHHRDPSQKSFAISESKRSFKNLLAESKKCALLCANCHRELHAGLLKL